MKKVKVLISWDKNYGAHCDLVPGCVATGKDLDGVKEAFNDALQAHIEGMIEDGDHVPVELRGEYDLEYHLNARALLKYTKGVVSRKALSEVAGINLQQLSHYDKGYRTPRPEMEQRIVAGIHELGQQLIAISM